MQRTSKVREVDQPLNPNILAKVRSSSELVTGAARNAHSVARKGSARAACVRVYPVARALPNVQRCEGKCATRKAG